MSNVTRFGPSPLLDNEVANKEYVDAGGGGGVNTQMFANSHHRDGPGSGDEFYAFCGITGGSSSAIDQNLINMFAGVLSLLAIEIVTNTSGVTNTFTTFIDGSVANQLVNVGAGLTGTFQDLVNTDTLAALALFCSEWTFTSGTGVTIGSTSVAMTYD